MTRPENFCGIAAVSQNAGSGRIEPAVPDAL